MSSAVATPSSNSLHASAVNTWNNLFKANPVTSLTSTGSFFISRNKSIVKVVVDRSVKYQGITSTSFIILAGELKCVPINLLARSGEITEDNLVTEILDVLLAIIQFSLHIASNLLYTSCLISTFSKTASTIKSQSDISSKFSVGIN